MSIWTRQWHILPKRQRNTVPAAIAGTFTGLLIWFIPICDPSLPGLVSMWRLRHGSSPMSISGINISVADPDDLHGIAPLPEPFFVLNTGFMELPWILDEQMEDVVSPANEPSYLQEMTNRILGLYPTENIQ